jgi:hypothetical protein
MAQTHNSTSYLTGGRIYSDGTVMSTNQSQQPTSATNSNSILGLLQDTAATLSALNSATPSDGACYEEGVGAQNLLRVDYLP